MNQCQTIASTIKAKQIKKTIITPRASNMVKARKYVVVKHFDSIPKRADFEIVEYDLPPLEDGEILIKVEWLSVDPYLTLPQAIKPHLNGEVNLPYDQYGYQVGIVEQSKNSDYPVGIRVVTHKGWCDYCVADPSDQAVPGQGVYKLPDLKGLSPSLGVGTVGMTGATAYFGFLEICKPKPGETVVVTGAAGAVGSIVGQIAKIKGCRVIGFAGSDDKVQWLEEELGFDKAFNYKTVDVTAALKQAAPDGIDCYFDNVGGKISSLIMLQMNRRGRVAICGSISAYSEFAKDMPLAPILQPSIASKQLKVEGFIVWQWGEDWPKAFTELVDWIKSGKLKAREHITEGFENAVDSITGMMTGENFGKAVVKV